jgi:hypothetical protein
MNGRYATQLRGRGKGRERKPPGNRVSAGRVLSRRLRRIIDQICGELSRLNHAGLARTTLRPRSRRECARLVKAALADRYCDHNRCC